jgi:DNA polymerase I
MNNPFDNYKNKLLLIDGNAMIWQAAYGFLPTRNEDEEVQNWAIKGFFRLLFSEIKKLKPTHVAVMFDHKSKKRADLSGGTYKANRVVPNADPEKEKIKQQTIEQFKPIRLLTKAMGFHVCRVKDIEADDLIGTYAKSYPNTGVIIRAVDKDFNQLICESVGVWDSWGTKKIVRDKAYVKERYGVGPKKFALYLALVGDKADNIGKVKGLGPKTAVSLIKTHKTLEKILIQHKKSDRKILTLGYALTQIDCNIVEVPALKYLRKKDESEKYFRLKKKYQL